jgi:hypothetical protein
VGGGARVYVSAPNAARGWGDLSTQALFERMDRHPTPPLIS